MGIRVAFHSFGCRLNQSETASLRNAFIEAGFDVVPLADAPDVVVVNTCTVTANGDTDTRRFVNRVVRTSPKAVIALVGCQSQLQGVELAQLPNVRWVVGNTHKMDLPTMVRGARPALVVDDLPSDRFTGPVSTRPADRTRANLKIQDGCDYFCAYCIVPYARGRSRSREFDNLLAEARALIAAGHKEIVLTGVNIGLYDVDGRNVLDVARALTALPGLARLRLSSIEPTAIPPELPAFLAEDPVACRHLHIPMQSGCDTILQRMARRHTTRQYRELIRQLVATVPGIGLGVDVIVGHPGETQTMFDETADFISVLPLSYLHVFSYSPRSGTPSAEMPDKVEPDEIRGRSQILRDIGARKRTAFLQGLLGQALPVLFEQRKQGRWTGLTDNYARVKLDDTRDLHNQLVRVRLDSIQDDFLNATLV